MKALLEKREYRSMNEINMRAQKYIEDEHLKTYFINKANDFLQTQQDDKDDLLDALYALSRASGKRPSLIQAQTSYLPDWDRQRLTRAAQALEEGGEITNITMRGLVNVDLTTAGRKRAVARVTPAPSQTIHIGEAHNSPIQQVGPGGSGSQQVHYKMDKTNLKALVDLYHQHIDELNLDASTRRRADAQISTIEAQLQDEPDPTVIKAAGKSLKNIIESAIGGALGNVAANPAVWAGLLTFFS